MCCCRRVIGRHSRLHGGGESGVCKSTVAVAVDDVSKNPKARCVILPFIGWSRCSPFCTPARPASEHYNAPPDITTPQQHISEAYSAALDDDQRKLGRFDADGCHLPNIERSRPGHTEHKLMIITKNSPRCLAHFIDMATKLDTESGWCSCMLLSSPSFDRVCQRCTVETSRI
jgi:hypothetical protein